MTSHSYRELPVTINPASLKEEDTFSRSAGGALPTPGTQSSYGNL